MRGDASSLLDETETCPDCLSLLRICVPCTVFLPAHLLFVCMISWFRPSAILGPLEI